MPNNNLFALGPCKGWGLIWEALSIWLCGCLADARGGVALSI